MPVVEINGSSKKMACWPCIRGHRSSKCTHRDRFLVEVRKPGRPLQGCPHSESSCGCNQRLIKPPERKETTPSLFPIAWDSMTSSLDIRYDPLSPSPATESRPAVETPSSKPTQEIRYGSQPTVRSLLPSDFPIESRQISFEVDNHNQSVHNPENSRSYIPSGSNIGSPRNMITTSDSVPLSASTSNDHSPGMWPRHSIFPANIVPFPSYSKRRCTCKCTTSYNTNQPLVTRKILEASDDEQARLDWVLETFASSAALESQEQVRYIRDNEQRIGTTGFDPFSRTTNRISVELDHFRPLSISSQDSESQQPAQIPKGPFQIGVEYPLNHSETSSAVSPMTTHELFTSRNPSIVASIPLLVEQRSNENHPTTESTSSLILAGIDGDQRPLNTTNDLEHQSDGLNFDFDESAFTNNINFPFADLDIPPSPPIHSSRSFDRSTSPIRSPVSSDDSTYTTASLTETAAKLCEAG